MMCEILEERDAQDIYQVMYEQANNLQYSSGATELRVARFLMAGLIVRRLGRVQVFVEKLMVWAPLRLLLYVWRLAA